MKGNVGNWVVFVLADESYAYLNTKNIHFCAPTWVHWIVCGSGLLVLFSSITTFILNCWVLLLWFTGSGPCWVSLLDFAFVPWRWRWVMALFRLFDLVWKSWIWFYGLKFWVLYFRRCSVECISRFNMIGVDATCWR